MFHKLGGLITNPESMDIEAFKDREDEGGLSVPKAGALLRRLRKL
jgi:peptide deformylase